MPQLKLEFDSKKHPTNPPAQFITRFYAFFRDYGVIETSEEEIEFRGEKMTKRDAYWLMVAEYIESLGAICKHTDFEDFGTAMLLSFVDAIQKTQNRYNRMVREKQAAIERERKRKEREERERNERSNTDGNTAG